MSAKAVKTKYVVSCWEKKMWTVLISKRTNNAHASDVSNCCQRYRKVIRFAFSTISTDDRCNVLLLSHTTQYRLLSLSWRYPTQLITGGTWESCYCSQVIHTAVTVINISTIKTIVVINKRGLHDTHYSAFPTISMIAEPWFREI